MLKSTRHTTRRMCYIRYLQKKLHFFIPTTFKLENSNKTKPQITLKKLYHCLLLKYKNSHRYCIYDFSIYSYEVTWYFTCGLLCLWYAEMSFYKVHTRLDWWTRESRERRMASYISSFFAKRPSIMESTM